MIKIKSLKVNSVFKVLILAFMLSFSSNPVSALIIVESTDFSNSFASPTDLGNFDLGINTITGSIESTEVTDAWFANLITGHKITDIEIIFSNQNITTGFVTAAVQGGGLFENRSTDGFLLGSDLPIDFSLDIFTTGLTTGSSGIGSTYDYEWKITVTSAIPEPTIIALFGVGLAGFGFVRLGKQ